MELYKELSGLIFLVGVNLFFWKQAINGLFGKKMGWKYRGVDITFAGMKAKVYGFLFFLAAAGMTWVILKLIIQEKWLFKFLEQLGF